ncbi:GNAT family N-acetyltransferase [Acetobacter orleanensis]|uniref:GCN5 family N-acetyltransferase n=1 Tax=Acetobacter orleanensis TaxID=104099 RepID=A0A4Y3TLI5_9PROT|nr:GNAT family protein [Acetobacter orleanensis]KXV62525.1 amino acid acetyltransferase [Acetobacter orleanensis]PCD80042.1 N-acetyltransferase [Acetobacter orleanensis]GAN68361.1 acetyltransferase [Acetobacter orleanensis JCM 7639]GBR29707.1 GCN5-related N-acetyltransferase [Acetobacter orleanensis NRIC 0473]GEB82792.1 GCN5 family N-acetyltransferase [Acetobacter orleanensis]
MTVQRAFPDIPVPLTGEHVQLVPLSPTHCAALQQAVQDGEQWKVWCTSVPQPDAMAADIARRLDLQKRGTMLPYTVVSLPDNRVVGMTSLMNIDKAGPRVEIGSTWYAASVQRTALNTEAKQLLLSYAFETLGCLAVELRTHVLNQRSRRAIERLGAKLDGILRCHQRLPDGSLRDSCVYSITAVEWPAVRSHLRWCLTEKYQRG